MENERLQNIKESIPSSSDSDIGPMSNEQCTVLVHGYSRSFYELQAMPSDIVRICVSFYSSWFDLKLVYCDDETGAIDLNKCAFLIKPISLESELSLKALANEIELEIFNQTIENARNKWSSQTDEELKEICDSMHICAEGPTEEMIDGLLWEKYGFDQRELDKSAFPLIHLWLKFKQIRAIYPIDRQRAKLTEEVLENEDGNRWVEVPDDYLRTKVKDIEWGNSHYLVIERCKISDWRSGSGDWPRASGDDWRETLKTGDIVECKDEQEKWYESLVRYVYPKDHQTMAGKCIIHYIGWNIKWDEPLDIDSERICKRYTLYSHAFRPRPRDQKDYPSEFFAQSNATPLDFDVNSQSQEDIDLQRAIAASLGQ